MSNQSDEIYDMALRTQAGMTLEGGFFGTNAKGNKTQANVWQRQRALVDRNIDEALKLVVLQLLRRGTSLEDLQNKKLLQIPPGVRENWYKELGSVSGSPNMSDKAQFRAACEASPEAVLEALLTVEVDGKPKGWIVNSQNMFPPAEMDAFYERMSRYENVWESYARDWIKHEAEQKTHEQECERLKADYREQLDEWVAAKTTAHKNDTLLSQVAPELVLPEAPVLPDIPRGGAAEHPGDPRIEWINSEFGRNESADEKYRHIVALKDGSAKKWSRALDKACDYAYVEEPSKNLHFTEVVDLNRLTVLLFTQQGVDDYLYLLRRQVDRAFIPTNYKVKPVDDTEICALEDAGYEAKATGYVHRQIVVVMNNTYNKGEIRSGTLAEIKILDPEQQIAEELTKGIYDVMRRAQLRYDGRAVFAFEKLDTPQKIEDFTAGYDNIMSKFAGFNQSRPRGSMFAVSPRTHSRNFPEFATEEERCRHMYWGMVNLHRSVHAMAAQASDTSMRQNYYSLFSQYNAETEQYLDQLTSGGVTNPDRLDSRQVFDKQLLEQVMSARKGRSLSQHVTETEHPLLKGPIDLARLRASSSTGRSF